MEFIKDQSINFFKNQTLTNAILESVTDELTDRLVAVRKLSEVAIKIMPSDDMAIPVFESIYKILSEDIQTKLWGIGEEDE